MARMTIAEMQEALRLWDNATPEAKAEALRLLREAVPDEERRKTQRQNPAQASQ